MTHNRGNTVSHENYGANLESFDHVRALGQRGVWTVLHPYTRQHIDVVDFDIEIEARHAAGLEGYGFWSTPLPEVDNQ